MSFAKLPLYGLDLELKQKLDSKYDAKKEQEVREWIEAIVNEKVEGPLDIALKDGQLICKLMNEILKKIEGFENAAIKINSSKMPFKQMENISSFLNAAEKIGCPKMELFQTVDLFESKNMVQVIDTMYSVSRSAAKKGYAGPLIGPKLADKHEVSFSEEKLNAGKNIVPLQMGFTGGANASGLSYGSRRQIDAGTGAGSKEGVSQQMGFAGGANASGMRFGSRREIDAGLAECDSSALPLQSGTNEGANASGLRFGSKREITQPSK